MTRMVSGISIAANMILKCTRKIGNSIRVRYLILFFYIYIRICKGSTGAIETTRANKTTRIRYQNEGI